MIIFKIHCRDIIEEHLNQRRFTVPFMGCAGFYKLENGMVHMPFPSTPNTMEQALSWTHRMPEDYYVWFNCQEEDVERVLQDTLWKNASTLDEDTWIEEKTTLLNNTELYGSEYSLVVNGANPMRKIKEMTAKLNSNDKITNHDAAEFLDNKPLGHSEQERQLARNWINTAAQYGRNAEYYRGERDRLGRLLIKFAEENDKDDYNICPICKGGETNLSAELTDCDTHTVDCELWKEVQHLKKLLENEKFTDKKLTGFSNNALAQIRDILNSK